MASDFETKLHERAHSTLPSPKKFMRINELDEVIEVVEILDTKITKDCQRCYLVSFRAWLPEERLCEYEHLIAQFWKSQTSEGWNESHSDKENKCLTLNNPPNGKHLSPLHKSFEKHFLHNGQNGVINSAHNDEDDGFHSNLNNASPCLEEQIHENGSKVGDVHCVKQETEPQSLVHQDLNEIPLDDQDILNHEDLDDPRICGDHEEMIQEYHTSDMENQDRSHESIDNFDSSETVDISLEENIRVEKQEDESEFERSSRPVSSFSDKTSFSCSDQSTSSSSSKPKKRKLKTLDDIVRKISGATEQPCDKRQTLDETLNESFVKTESSREEIDVVNDDDDPESKGNLSFDNETTQKEHNVYWSAGKASFMKPVRAFRCFPCDQLFEFDYELRNHQRSIHGEETPNVENGFAIDNRGNLADVERQVLSKNESKHQYVCHKCNIDFNSSSSLDNHRYEVHSARRRYEKCSYCPTMYSDPALLRKHESLHFRGYDLYRPESGAPPPLAQSERRDFDEYRIVSNGQNGHSLYNGREIRPRKSSGRYHDNEKDSGMRNSFEPSSNIPGKIHYSVAPSRDQRLRDVATTQGETQKDDSSCPPKDLVMRDSLPQRFVQLLQEHRRGVHQLKSPPYAHSPVNHSTQLQTQNGDERVGEKGFQEFIRICPLCKQSFGKKDAFDHHWLTTHGEQTIFNCDACKRTFFSEDKFHAHLSQHRRFVCHFCGQQFNELLEYETHMKEHEQKRPFQCQLCGRRFSLKTNLRRHMTIHMEGFLYRCQLCSKGFKADVELNQHMQEFHGRFLVEEKQNITENATPTTENSYTHEHQQNIGPPSPVYQQPLYVNEEKRPIFRNEDHIDKPKSFIYEKTKTEILSPHRLSAMHLDSKMLPNLVPARFSPRRPGTVHLMPAPHGVSVLMKCHECNEEFTSKSLYEIHVQSHVKEMFSCPKCPKTFTKRSLFDSHLISHENNKSHNCPYCHRSFSMKGNLRRHIRIHTNEAPYECSICFQRFRRSDGLKGHVKRHETMGESAPADMVPSQASAQTVN